MCKLFDAKDKPPRRLKYTPFLSKLSKENQARVWSRACDRYAEKDFDSDPNDPNELMNCDTFGGTDCMKNCDKCFWDPVENGCVQRLQKPEEQGNAYRFYHLE